MVSWTAISRDEHANACFRLRQGFDFAANQQVVEVLIKELAELIPHYACGFTKDEDGSYKLVALLGLGGDRNLFVDFEHKWLCEYVPATLRAYPFTLADKPDSDSNERILCINTDYLTDDPEATSIFDGEGNLGSEVTAILEFLNKCDRGRLQTQVTCAALDDAKLITSWDLSISGGEDQGPQKVSGLYRIDETALYELDSSVVTGLMKSGAIALAYAQLFSMHQIHKLDIYKRYLTQQQEERNSKPEVTGLLSEDEGSLNFDGV